VTTVTLPFAGIVTLRDMTPCTTSRSRGQLTPRQREVLRLVADGLSTVQIARVLRLSSHTVDSHVGSARTKLGARTREHAALLAAAPRAVTPSDGDHLGLLPVHAELLQVLAGGASVAQAARSTHVSTRTAYRRLDEARWALGARSWVGAVVQAERLGLLRQAGLTEPAVA
jgi:DNA-binding CsgD family transcriptional regulator